MAMIHHYIHKTNALTRMLPNILNPRKLLFLNITVIAILALALTILILGSMTPALAQTAAGGAAETATTPVAAPAWQIIPDKSRLGFKANYGGVEFDGRFKEFTAKILFDPKTPETGSFDVSIDTTSITTFNAERDSVIGDQDWFYFSQYPKSTYATKSIRAEGEQFIAIGTLDLKGAWGRGIVTPAVFEANKWYYVCGVVDNAAGKVQAYVDSVQKLSQDFPVGDSPGTPSAIWVGNSPENYQAIKGVVDDVGFFNVALTAADMSTLMTKGLSGALLGGATAVDPQSKVATTWALVKSR